MRDVIPLRRSNPVILRRRFAGFYKEDGGFARPPINLPGSMFLPLI